MSENSQSHEHELSANCIRKCTNWQLQIHIPKVRDGSQHVAYVDGSGIALTQMNYKFEPGLPKEELNMKKAASELPTGPIPFTHDLIDKMLEHEDSLIFDGRNENKHDRGCK